MTQKSIDQIIEATRASNKISPQSFRSVSSIRTEIRQRRKHIIGSFVSVQDLVCSNGLIEDQAVTDLSEYLADRTELFWGNESPNVYDFCFKFYQITLTALASGEVGDESVDDLIQFAECLARSIDTFIVVIKELIPYEMYGPMYFVTEEFEQYFPHTGTFEDAVLGAVAVFLGVLKDPVSSQH